MSYSVGKSGRQKPLSRTATREAQKVLEAACPNIKQAFVVTQDILRAYLKVAHMMEQAQLEDWRVGEVAKQISVLEVGEELVLPAMPLQAVRARYLTARKLSEQPDAVYTAKVVGDEVHVKRLPDGADPRAHVRQQSPITRELAAMAVGESKHPTHIKSVRGKGQMGSNHKIGARRLLDSPTADWRIKSKGRRLVLTRIS